jgi:hypothetical protein
VFSRCASHDSDVDEPSDANRQKPRQSRSTSKPNQSCRLKKTSAENGKVPSFRTDALMGRLSRISSYDSLIEAIGDAASKINPLDPSSVFEALNRQFGRVELLEDDDDDDDDDGNDSSDDDIEFGRRASRCSSNTGSVSGRHPTTFLTSQFPTDLDRGEQVSTIKPFTEAPSYFLND